MSYYYGAPGYPGAYPSPTPGMTADVAAMRQRQIDSLRQLGLQYREIERGTRFEVPVPLPQPYRPMSIIVSLPQSFPTTPPQMIVSPPVYHTFVDPQTGAVLPHASENLRGWGMHCNLGKLVWDIQQKFMSDPPKEVPNGYSPVPAVGGYPPPNSMGPAPIGPGAQMQPQVVPQSASPYPPPASLPGGPAYQQQQQQQQQVSRPGAAFNPSSIPLPQLDTMTIEQLNELASNESRLDDFISRLAPVVELNKMRAELRESNVALAKKNEAAAAEVEHLRAEFEEARAAAEQARAVYAEKAAAQEAALSRFAPTALAQRLEELAAESDKASEDVSSRFLAGEMTLSEFVRQYRELRAQYHTRSAKREAFLHPH